MTYLLLAAGLVLLVLGGDVLVRGAVRTAEGLGISPLLVGLTIVGFGTSTPELITSVQAALLGSPGIAVGNVVGSNIANILLILGVAGLIFPFTTTRRALIRDGGAMLAATLLAIAAALYGSLGELMGAVLVAGLAAYLFLAYRDERVAGGTAAEGHSRAPAAQLMVPLLLTVVGLALTMFGARLLVTSSIELATNLGVSESVIGLTIVAIGTSLPELVAGVMAAIRRHGDVALGNVIGSNIYNILGILGLTAIIHPIDVPADIVAVDIWVMLGATLAVLFFARTGWRIGRREAGFMLAAYVVYIIALALR